MTAPRLRRCSYICTYDRICSKFASSLLVCVVVHGRLSVRLNAMWWCGGARSVREKIERWVCVRGVESTTGGIERTAGDTGCMQGMQRGRSSFNSVSLLLSTYPLSFSVSCSHSQQIKPKVLLIPHSIPLFAFTHHHSCRERNANRPHFYLLGCIPLMSVSAGRPSCLSTAGPCPRNGQTSVHDC